MSMLRLYFCTKVITFDTHALKPHSCRFNYAIYVAVTKVFVVEIP